MNGRRRDDRSGRKFIFFLIIVLIAFILPGTGAVPVNAQSPDWDFTVGHEYVSGIDVSSDGELVLVGTTMGKVHLFDKQGNMLWNKYIPGRLMVEILGDNSSFIVGSQESLEKNKGVVRCYDRNGTQLWREVTGWVTGIGFSKAPVVLAVGTRTGDVIVFDAGGSRLGSYNDFPKTYVVNGIGIAGDGSRVAYSLFESKPALEVVTVSNGRRRISTRVENSNLIDLIRISGDGEYIATKSGDGSISDLSLYNKNGKVLWSKPVSKINDLLISEDGGLILTASEDSFLRVFGNEGDPLWNFSRKMGINSISINLDQGIIASGSGDGHIDLFNLSGELMWSFQVKRFPESKISSVKISDDAGSVIAVVNDKEILYYSLKARPGPTPVEPEATPGPDNSTRSAAESAAKTPQRKTIFFLEENSLLWNSSRVLQEIV